MEESKSVLSIKISGSGVKVILVPLAIVFFLTILSFDLGAPWE
jgi:hypothetical protein